MSSHLRAWLLKRSIVCLPVCNRCPSRNSESSLRLAIGGVRLGGSSLSTLPLGDTGRAMSQENVELLHRAYDAGAISMLCSPSVTPTWSSSLT
jgi:hypothetical protein